ncbi:MAG: PDGLE domain-containing protein [Actinobacteria bacterium]|nr:PDGLE domain-containing protein [Actinomycetota bacterium]
MKKFMLIGLIISTALVFLIAPFASSWPDGLERVAINLGFAQKGMSLPTLRSPLPNYMLNFIKNERLSTVLAGLIGVMVIFLLVYVIGFLLKRKQNMDKN